MEEWTVHYFDKRLNSEEVSPDRLALTHAGVIAWSRTGDPDLGDWGPLVRTGVIPDEFEAGGGVE
jgi:hypothetical protein